MNNQIAKKMTSILFVGFLSIGMIYATATLGPGQVSAATCDCSSLAPAAAADCFQRFGNSGFYSVGCFESEGRLWFDYHCVADPFQDLFEQSCQL